MDFDVAIIGAGPGGYTAAIRLAQLGKNVALIEKEELGGTCVNKGCIPTKVYLYAAELMSLFDKAKAFGFSVNYDFEIEILKKKKERTVKKLVSGLGYLMKHHKVEVIKGEGIIADKNCVNVNNKEIKVENIIIATGSKPSKINVKGADIENVIDSEEALKLTKIPDNIVIIGAGVIGIEFACIYKALGCNVCLIEVLERPLPFLDDDIIDILFKSLKSKKITFYLNSKVTAISNCYVEFENKDGKKTLQCDQVLMATGRAPELDYVENINIKSVKTGIVIDEYMRTNIDNIYAIGDVTGQFQLAHTAAYQGIVTAHNIAGKHLEADLSAVPSCIYSLPEVAVVGLSENEAKRKFGKIKIGKFPYMASGKAYLMEEKEGLVKVIADEQYNKILGAQIIGRSSTELIHELTLAIKEEFVTEELADTIHAHPTLSESVKEACDDLLGFPINKI